MRQMAKEVLSFQKRKHAQTKMNYKKKSTKESEQGGD
jgi:hypothetical protein